MTQIRGFSVDAHGATLPRLESSVTDVANVIRRTSRSRHPLSIPAEKMESLYDLSDLLLGRKLLAIEKSTEGSRRAPLDHGALILGRAVELCNVADHVEIA